MLALGDVTIVGITNNEIPQTINAIEWSCKDTMFGAKRLLCANDPGVPYWVKVPVVDSIEEYSRFCVHELYKYFTTKFVMVVHPDGFIINPEIWTYEFLKYDWIGAPWFHGDLNHPVGNGGFSIRSRKLVNRVHKDPVFKDWYHPEDDIICRKQGAHLAEKYKLKFAPLELAMLFSHETGRPPHPTFGFHGRSHLNYYHYYGKVPFNGDSDVHKF